MEMIVGGLILTQVYSIYMTSKDRKALLNAIVAKTPNEFRLLQAEKPKRARKPVSVQDDANIPYGL